MQVLKNQFVYTRRGVLDSLEVDLNDEIYTSKHRWQPINSFDYKPLNKFSKTNLASLRVGLPYDLKVDTPTPEKLKSYFPTEINKDSRNEEFWFNVGCAVAGEIKPQSIEVKRLFYSIGSIYSPTFNLPINILTLDDEKLQAFMYGLSAVGRHSISKKANFIINTCALKLLLSDKRKRPPETIITLDEPSFLQEKMVKIINIDDIGYCINGMVINPIKFESPK